MKIEIQVINAFSKEGRGGNPAGVVFDADGLSANSKQAIATAAGFPETAFVSSSSKADFKLDFFTPTKQIPHCGHATIATFTLLKKQGRINGDVSSKETIDGCRTILFKNGEAFMEQKSPWFLELPDPGELYRSLGISEDDLQPGMPPTIVNTGNSFLVVAVRNEDVLSGIRYDKEEVYRISEKYNLIGYYLYAATLNYEATTRMFAPFYGIDEEPATGMAAGPLAAYLWKYAQHKQSAMHIEQGRFMQPASPSLIKVDLNIEEDQISGLYAGGGAHVSDSVILDLVIPK
jgi:PhzF family phenazine biosynthesis protein